MKRAIINIALIILGVVSFLLALTAITAVICLSGRLLVYVLLAIQSCAVFMPVWAWMVVVAGIAFVAAWAINTVLDR